MLKHTNPLTQCSKFCWRLVLTSFLWFLKKCRYSTTKFVGLLRTSFLLFVNLVVVMGAGHSEFSSSALLPVVDTTCDTVGEKLSFWSGTEHSCLRLSLSVAMRKCQVVAFGKDICLDQYYLQEFCLIAWRVSHLWDMNEGKTVVWCVWSWCMWGSFDKTVWC